MYSSVCVGVSLQLYTGYKFHVKDGKCQELSFWNRRELINNINQQQK